MSAQRASTGGRKWMQRWAFVVTLLRPSRLSIAMIVVGGTISIVTGAAALSWARHEARHMLNDHFHFAQIAIGQRLRAYSDALEMVGARLSGSDLDATAFRHFVGRLRLRSRLPGIRAVLFARRVPDKNGHGRLRIAEATPSAYDGLIGRALSTLRPPLHVAHGEARMRLSRLSATVGSGVTPDYVLELPIYRDGPTGRALAGAACMLLRMRDLFQMSKLLDPITLEHVAYECGTSELEAPAPDGYFLTALRACPRATLRQEVSDHGLAASRVVSRSSFLSVAGFLFYSSRARKGSRTTSTRHSPWWCF